MTDEPNVTAVRAICADRYLFVEVEDSDGRVGLGECGAWGHVETARAAVEKFGDALIGEPAGAIEWHWNRMHRFGWFRGAAICAAISGIDIALWDLKGQRLGQPIHALLGGPVRRSARLYAHVKAATKDEMIAACRARMRQGFTAIGHLNPFLDEDRSVPHHRAHAAKIDAAARVVADLRAALGPDIDLCIEIHRRLTPAEAVVFAEAIAPDRPMFYEDPMPPTSAEAMGRIADQVTVPIATGERFATINDFQSHILRGAMRYARVSVCLCGGITGAKKIAALAEAFDVGVIPHNPLSPVSLHACLHLVAAIPNFVIQEYPTVGLEYDKAEDDDVDDAALAGASFVTALPEVSDGYAAIPRAPGLGTALSEAGRTAPMRARQVSMRAHRDGFLVDQ